MELSEVSFGIALQMFKGNTIGSGEAKSYFPIDYDYPLNDILSWEQVKQTATDAEKMGYDSLWFPDHFMLGHESFEAWTAMTTVAALTSKIKLGSFMLCNNYRSPALVAKMASTLSILSGGRLVLGYGAGWYEPEYEAYGYYFPPPRERIDMLREGLVIIRGLLEKPVFTYLGKYYKVV